MLGGRYEISHWHGVVAQFLILTYDGYGVRRCETRISPVWAAHDSTGMRGIVKTSLRVSDNVHRGDIRRRVLVRMKRHGQFCQIRFRTKPPNLLDRSSFDGSKAPRRQPQSISERPQVMLPLDAERASVQGTVFYQYVAE